jgi:hypothetical protein
LFLLLQAVAYGGVGIYLLLPLDWRAVLQERVDLMLPQRGDALSLGIILIPAAILAVLSAIGFLLRFRAGWLLAMAMQGTSLLGCLVLYFDKKPRVIFPIMLFCIVMAFYLNSTDVRMAFYGRTAGHGD